MLRVISLPAEILRESCRIQDMTGIMKNPLAASVWLVSLTLGTFGSGGANLLAPAQAATAAPIRSPAPIDWPVSWPVSWNGAWDGTGKFNDSVSENIPCEEIQIML